MNGFGFPIKWCLLGIIFLLSTGYTIPSSASMLSSLQMGNNGGLEELSAYQPPPDIELPGRREPGGTR